MSIIGIAVVLDSLYSDLDLELLEVDFEDDLIVSNFIFCNWVELIYLGVLDLLFEGFELSVLSDFELLLELLAFDFLVDSSGKDLYDVLIEVDLDGTNF